MAWIPTLALGEDDTIGAYMSAPPHRRLSSCARYPGESKPRAPVLRWGACPSCPIWFTWQSAHRSEGSRLPQGTRSRGRALSGLRNHHPPRARRPRRRLLLPHLPTHRAQAVRGLPQGAGNGEEEAGRLSVGPELSDESPDSAAELGARHRRHNICDILAIVTSTEVIRELRRDGWVEVRVRGSHHHFTHPTKPGIVTVPHPKKDIPVGTLASIGRQAGFKLR